MDHVKQYLGVDIGGTAVKIGLVNEAGTVISEGIYPDNFDGYETPILDTVLKSTDSFLEEYAAAPESLCGIGVSATGLIDSEKGVVIGGVDHIRNWNGSRIRERMQERYALPVSVLNDANCAALGEFFTGAARGAANVIAVTVGTGIGGGILVNSRLLMGERGLSGEIGNMIMHISGRDQKQDFHYYEQYASTTALVRMVREDILCGKIKGMDETQINGMAIFDTLKKGNEELRAVTDRWTGYVAAGLVSLIHIFNPELILIGGGVSAQKELFIDPLRQQVMAAVMPAYRENLRMEAAALKNNAGLVGAVYYCMQEAAKSVK